MKSLIIGARGLVGSALAKQLPNAILGIPVEAKKLNERYTDVTKYETLFKVFSNERPDVVYLPAAIAHVDKCEDSQGTEVVNVNGALTVLSLCESFGSQLVYFSSSYVFDGKKKEPYTTLDETNPINEYGRQKDRVEKAIFQSNGKHLIVRTVGVFGTERLKKNFGKQVVSALFSDKKVFVPNDQKMNPVLSHDLARCAIRLAENSRGGLYHVAGDRCLSKYEFALEIAKHLDKLVGVNKYTDLIVPLTTAEMKQKAPRPLNGCLECAGITVPSFDGGLARFLSMEFN